MRRALTLLAVSTCLLWAGSAHAQSSNDLGQVALFSGPPTLGALFCDVMMAVSMSQDGTVRRGFSITGLVFSGIDVMDSLLVLAIGLSEGSRQIPPLAGSAIGLGIASGVFSFYALFHAPPEPPERPPPSRARPTPEQKPDASPPVVPGSSAPFQLRLIPWTGPSMGGLTLFARF